MKVSPLLVALICLAGFATPGSIPPSLPNVTTPPAGDPRLESLPGSAVELVNVPVFGDGVPLTMVFPPRVNGQNESDGDRHADFWVLFNSATGQPINQPPVVETVPYGAALGVTDLSARMFSGTWAVHALMVDPSYDPSNLSTRIDSAAKIATSTLLINDYQTNIFFNGPVVPNGTVADAPSPQPIQAFFLGQLITLVPYEIDDGPFNPQSLFEFVNPSGTILGAPYLVASRSIGDPFYSPVWEVLKVHVPAGFDVTTITTLKQVQQSGFKVSSAQIRINASVIAKNGVPISFTNPVTLLTQPDGTFSLQKFPFDNPASASNKPQTFVIAASTPGAGAPAAKIAKKKFSRPGASSFPLVANGDKGNVIPLLLVNPFQTNTSGPNSSGPTIRIDQADLDAAFQSNNPPLLPAAIEANITQLISAGVLDPQWAPGVNSYQDRLGLIGQALLELVWQTPQGANPKDTTNCNACHSQPMDGGAARGLYTFPGSGTSLKVNPGSMWGSGSEELLYNQLIAAGAKGLTFPHGSLGTIKSIRGDITTAPNDHIGMQSAEYVANQTGNPGGYNATTDLDKDGVVNEISVGEVTAITEYLMSLSVPNPASPEAEALMGVSDSDVQAGKSLFRTSIDKGGAGCYSCHTVFRVLTGNVFQLKNPQTTSSLPITLTYHTADQDDVNDGLAQFVGQMGLRLYGDIKQHKLGALDAGSGTDTMKTAELWDEGSVFPYLRDGSAGSSVLTAILAHEGVYLSGITVTRGKQFNTVVSGQKVSGNVITIQNTTGSAINASSSAPIRMVLTGSITPGVTAFNSAGKGADGGLRQGAFWLIRNPIPAGGTATITTEFLNPNVVTLQYGLAVQDNTGYSEAVAYTQAFKALPQTQQNQIVTFLRAQLIDDYVGEQ